MGTLYNTECLLFYIGMNRMKNNKKMRFLISTVLLVVVNFVCTWFFYDLLSSYWILFLLPYCLIVLMLLIMGIKSIIQLVKNHKVIYDYLPFVLILLYLLFWLSGGIRTLNFKVLKKMRYNVIDMIEKENPEKDEESWEVTLPQKHRAVSTEKAVVVFDGNKGNMTVGFWKERGFLDVGMTMYVYQSGNDEGVVKESIMHAWPWGKNKEVRVESLEENWFEIYCYDSDYLDESE